MSNVMSEAELKAFLIERISFALRIKNKQLDPDAPFARYGLESIDSVILAMELEEEIGVVIEPTLLWEYNTINTCAAFFHKYLLEQNSGVSVA